MDVRAGNVTALQLMSSLRARTPRLAFTARAWAFDLGRAPFRPDVFAHTPGVSIGTADNLSRRTDPAHVGDAWPPPTVAHIPETVLPMRTREFFHVQVPKFPDGAAEQEGVNMGSASGPGDAGFQ